MERDEETRGTGSCLGCGRSWWIRPNADLSRHLLQGFLLADQTPTVRLVQLGGLGGSRAC